MSRTFTLVADADAGRLDRFVADRLPELSRSRLHRLISQGMVTLDGAPAKPASRLRRSQQVTVVVPDPVESHLKPQRMALDVVHEDDDVIVIDKPAGLSVHPGPGHPDETLANAVLAMCPGLQDIGGTVRPGIVHRLDKDTSGLIAVAKNERAQSELSSQVRRRGFAKGVPGADPGPSAAAGGGHRGSDRARSLSTASGWRSSRTGGSRRPATVSSGTMTPTPWSTCGPPPEGRTR